MRLAIALVAALAAVASAGPPPAPLAIDVAPTLVARLGVPAGWTEQASLSAQATTAVTRIGAGARRPVTGSARAWAAADGSALLVLTWVGPSDAETDAEAVDAARAFVKDFGQRVRRGMFGAKVAITAEQTGVAGKAARDNVEWQVKKQKLHGVTHAEVVALAKHGFRAVVAQCAYRERSKAGAACTQAAASLALVPAAEALTLEGGIAPAPTPAPEPGESPRED